MVEFVVKIPKEKYKIFMDILMHDFRGCELNILPSGHGRLIDADKVIKIMEEREERLKDDRSMYETSCVKTALDMFGETILEADE